MSVVNPKGLVDNLLGSCDGHLKLELVQLAAEYEHRLQLGQKPIFHLEAFVISFMAIYKRFVEDALGPAFSDCRSSAKLPSCRSTLYVNVVSSSELILSHLARQANHLR
ncbi:hypothetical protein AHF37_07038 [Paragonimus kellicotti]|nr:hypothetical protein AHF37_07038 [Paragonimus kellicotti]